MDPDYRRLLYVRYADDFLLGLIGSKAEAEDIKERLAVYLGTQLHLTLAAEKTLMTHAQTGRARFLGYEIGVQSSQTKRVVNGRIGLYVPRDVLESKRKRFLKDGKIMHRTELINDEEFDIIYRYQWEYRGLVEYYAMAHNLSCLTYLKWTMETSLLKTLATKNRTTTTKMYKRLHATAQTPQGPRKCLTLTIPRAGKKPLTATFGGISLARRQSAIIKDQVLISYIYRRSAVVDRLLRNVCEVCGSQTDVEIHHVRKMADLNKPGRGEKPIWMQIMIGHGRKTLAVCHTCHMDIHHNRPKSTR